MIAEIFMGFLHALKDHSCTLHDTLEYHEETLAGNKTKYNTYSSFPLGIFQEGTLREIY